MNLFIDFFYKKTVIKYTANVRGRTKTPKGIKEMKRL